MSRLQKLAAWTLGVTLVQVAIGGFTRGSGSGYGCADRWPLCENGLLGGFLPRPEFHMVVEWTHRFVANLAGLLVLALLVVVWRRYRDHRALRRAAAWSLVAIVVQALLGAVVVKTDLAADLVSLHLGVALLLVALLTVTLVESAFAGGRRPVSAEPDPGWRRWLLGAAGTVYGVVLLGTAVHDQYVGGYPLVGGRLIPRFTDTVVALHFGHRVAVAVGLFVLASVAAQAVRRGRPAVEVRLVHTGLALYLVNVGLGAAHVFTRVSSTGLVVAHLLVASLCWTAFVAAAALARRAAAPVALDRPSSAGARTAETVA